MASNIGTAEVSDLENAEPDFEAPQEVTDGTGGDKETIWINENWEEWYGYYTSIDQSTPDLNGVINTISTYTIGKGFTADEETTKILKGITGMGKDTFATIIENAITTGEIGGDSYAEITRDKSGKLLNLKPLDPSVMQHVLNSKGRLKRFEQLSKNDRNKIVQKFELDEIFYLPRNRIADNSHGTSLTEKVVQIILMINEAMADMKVLMHRHIKPFAIYELNTDDAVKIAEFKAQKDAATKGAENIYVAMGSVKVTPVVMQAGAIKEAREWIEQLNGYFYRGAGVPKVLLGDSSKNAEAGVKMEYFAFQQRTASRQLDIVEQIKAQLGLTVSLPEPASLEKDLQRDNTKDGSAVKPSDTKATLGGKQV